MSEHIAVDGPSVWLGGELAASPAWNERFTPQQLAELIDPTTESHPALDELGRRLGHELEHGSGAVRLRGLDLAQLTEAAAGAAFSKLASCIGTPVSQSTNGETMFRVADAQIDPSDRRARGPNSRTALTFHSDRCDVIGFLCVRTAQSGGDNLLVSAGAIHNEIQRRSPELFDTLYRPFAWMRHTIDGTNRHSTYQMPIFARTDSRFAVTLMQVLIERAHRSPELPDLTTDQRDALEMIQTIAADPRFHLRFRQQPGEILLLNNYVTLHSRTAFDDPRDSAGRLLLRVWLSVPDSRRLPAAWAPHYGQTEPGVLRGGIRPAE